VPPRLLNPSIPRDLETVCLKCLEKDVRRRYDTAQALAADLGRFLNDQSVMARPVGPAGKAGRWCRRNPRLASAMGVAVVSVLLGFAGILWQWRRAASGELLARQNAYAADMLLAQHALANNNRGLAVSLLDKHRPAKGGKSEVQNPKIRGICGIGNGVTCGNFARVRNCSRCTSIRFVFRQWPCRVTGSCWLCGKAAKWRFGI